MSKGMRRGVNSRLQHPRVPRYFLHHHLWTMACSCKAWSRRCRPSHRLMLHCKLNCRHRLKLQLQFPRIKAMVALSTAWRQESEMDQYIEKKRAAQKRLVPPFQRQDRKKAVVYQQPQHSIAAPSQQAVVPQTPNFRPNDKKACPHCGRTHDGSECWKLAGKCLKCGSTEHQIKDCPTLQQFAQRGAPALVAAAAAEPVTRKPGRPRAQARAYALACTQARSHKELSSSSRLEDGKKVSSIISCPEENATVERDATKRRGWQCRRVLSIIATGNPAATPGPLPFSFPFLE
ncbi:hypothetical protein Taro_008501 [Colocasia esculenta]|uniref:CCHC-type domain-containing protein n=1 Tax=Colocasia esculenta TaxID=4460 RepID=A0A843U372_COLES|nr:hypothetical protein [Colocasia esculenta]